MKSVMCALLVVMASTASAATGPVKDLDDLVKYVSSRPETPWKSYRVIGFRGLEDDREAKRAAHFTIETLNRVSRRAPIYQINDNLWAVNTEALGWPATAWDEMSIEWPYYASLKTVAPKHIDYFKKVMGTEFPVMRADVFVKQAWEPEWYVKLLRIPDNREKFYNAERLDLRTAQVVAVVKDDLSVSKHPRKAARVKTADGRVAWVSMGYENCRGVNDSVAHPTNFTCDYNEIMIEMKNGLDMYAAFDGKTGNRLGGSAFGERDLPTTVVEDFTPTGPQVLLGVSCVSCHKSGARPLDHAAKFAELDFMNAKEPYSALFAKYSKDEAARRSHQDSERWTAALKSLVGIDPESNQKAWRSLIASYDRPVTIEVAARELGVSIDVLRRLGGGSRGALADLANGAVVSRSDWENAFGAAISLASR